MSPHAIIAPKTLINPTKVPVYPFKISIKAIEPPSDLYTSLNLLIIAKDNNVSLHQIHGPIGHYTEHAVSIPFEQENIDKILITPQSGKWGLEEVQLKQFGTSLLANKPLIFRDYYKNKSPYLDPLFPFLELPLNFKEKSDEEYKILKDKILITAVQTTSIGSVAAFYITGQEKAFAFAIGGLLGLTYALLLQESVDRLRVDQNDVKVVTLRATLRQLLIFSVAANIIVQYKHVMDGDNSLFIFAIIGFFLTRLGYFLR